MEPVRYCQRLISHMRFVGKVVVMNYLRYLFSLTVMLLSLLLGACAEQRAIPREPPRCMASETLVCYGRTASKLDTRLDEVEFCHCERVIDGL